MTKLKTRRFITLLGPVLFCCMPGCDPLYEIDVVVTNRAGEPLTEVSYNVIESPDKRSYRMNVARGQTNSDGRVLWGTVGKCDLLVELEKPGFKKVSKKVEMKRPGSPPVVLEMEEER